MFNYRAVKKAPKGAARTRRLKADVLAKELAIAVLRLALQPDRPAISRASVQSVSPVLAGTYTRRQSTIPTYLGDGRSDDGLGLWRPRAGKPWPMCQQNAALALSHLEQSGHSPAVVAGIIGTTEAALLEAIAALPPYEGVVPAND